MVDASKLLGVPESPKRKRSVDGAKRSPSILLTRDDFVDIPSEFRIHYEYARELARWLTFVDPRAKGFSCIEAGETICLREVARASTTFCEQPHVFQQSGRLYAYAEVSIAEELGKLYWRGGARVRLTLQRRTVSVRSDNRIVEREVFVLYEVQFITREIEASEKKHLWFGPLLERVTALVLPPRGLIVAL